MTDKRRPIVGAAFMLRRLTVEVHVPDLDRFADDLLDTPIGDLELRVMPPGDWVGVCIKSDDDRRPGRCLHTLDGCVWDAIYGKRKFEQASVRALYRLRDERKAAGLEANLHDVKADMGRDFERWLHKHNDDARDILAATMVR